MVIGLSYKTVKPWPGKKVLVNGSQILVSGSRTNNRNLKYHGSGSEILKKFSKKSTFLR